MNYLITAAGLGKRFRDAGVKPSKPLIKVRGNELLLWSLTSFNFDNDDNVYIITLKADKVKNKISKKINLIYPKISFFWLEIDDPLNGQLLTSLYAVDYFKIKGQLLIHNCDTSYKFDYKKFFSILNSNIFGVIPYFHAEGNNWSFIQIENDKIIDVREKERISDNCSLGTYFFRDAEEFTQLSEEYLKIKQKKIDKEIYIAPLYKYAISKSKLILPMIGEEVKIFGTCDELLKTFEISFYELISENDFNANQRKTLVVDIDGTLCDKPINGDYSKCIPIDKVLDKLKYEHSIGTYIILYTSRNMRSFRGNIGLINKYTSLTLNKWLFDNKVPFDELYFGKPWGNDLSYIDDKSLQINEFINS